MRNWILNFDIWGSYLPLSPHSWDIQQARATAYEKLSIMRACLRDTLATNRKQLADQKREQAKIDLENGNSPSKYAKKVSRIQESLILTDLMTKISILEFYLGKIEA